MTVKWILEKINIVFEKIIKLNGFLKKNYI